jgi:1-acyl-sn-glycerol-3-phosphate acyltransferase
MGLLADVRQVARGWRWSHHPLVPASAQAHLPARSPKEFPTAWARRPFASAVREGIQVAALDPLLRFELHRRVLGLDVLDALQPPVVFVANHASHLDTPLLLLSLPDEWRRRTTVAAAADYFFDTWWRAVGSALVFNTFPIERRSGSLARTPGLVLRQGWNVVVFPEGTRSPDGWMRGVRLGAAYLAAEHRVPVVPVAIRGTFAAMPRGRSWPAPGRPPVRVRFGGALRLGESEPPRDFARRIAGSLARLLDEDESTWWEAARRAASGETPPASGPPVAQWRRLWESSAPPAPEQGRTPRHRVWK